MRILSCLSTALFVFSLSTAHAKLPDIDSSDWAADPVDYGMTAGEYINAESRALFDDFIGRAGGINNFHHWKTLATAEDRWIVSPNNDTLYSVAVVNVTEGFTLKLPDTGDRFLSIQIVDEDHMTPFHLYGGGTREFTADLLVGGVLLVRSTGVAVEGKIGLTGIVDAQSGLFDVFYNVCTAKVPCRASIDLNVYNLSWSDFFPAVRAEDLFYDCFAHGSSLTL